MQEMHQKLYDSMIIPVVKLDRAEDAVPLAKALCDGGLPVAEVTFRTECAGEAIEKMVKAYPEMLVGAGTVLTIEQADRAIAAGAKFIVSPGLNPRVVSHCIEKGIPIVPGCANPSDVECAIELGLTAVKFFPAEQAGGLPMIKAMSAPYTKMLFMPTGGVNEQNISDYLAFEKILACGGSWMVPPKLIAEGKFDEISALTRSAINKVLSFQLAHVGINSDNQEAAHSTAKLIATMFGFSMDEKSASYFAGSGVEVMKTPFRGKNGHIGFSTPQIERAVAYLERQGVKFDKSSENRDAKGNLKAIYLAEEFGGFAMHLVKR